MSRKIWKMIKNHLPDRNSAVWCCMDFSDWLLAPAAAGICAAGAAAAAAPAGFFPAVDTVGGKGEGSQDQRNENQICKVHMDTPVK